MTDLAGFTDGAESLSVAGDRPQIDQLDGIVYAQVIAPPAVRALTMSLFVARTPDRKPAIVYVPGGGFTSAARGKFLEMRIALAQAGYVVAAADYRVVPSVFPAPLEDGKAAIRYLRAHAATYGIDPDRIGVLGDSAGGWLALLLATTGDERACDTGDWANESSAVQAAASLYGISDLTNIGEGFPAAVANAHRSPAVAEALLVNGVGFDDFAGAPIDDHPAKARAAGAMGHVDTATPPILLMHGTADTLVSPVQSRQLFDALKARGRDVRYVLVEQAGHGDLAWYQPAVIDRVVAWFRTTLGAPDPGDGPAPDAHVNL